MNTAEKERLRIAKKAGLEKERYCMIKMLDHKAGWAKSFWEPDSQ